MITRLRLFVALLTALVAATASAQTATILSISPSVVYVDSASLTLTVSGTGFASGDYICFFYGEYGCEYLARAYVSSTELTAQVPSSFLAYVDTYPSLCNRFNGCLLEFCKLQRGQPYACDQLVLSSLRSGEFNPCSDHCDGQLHEWRYRPMERQDPRHHIC
jgi:hypothetical protein